MNEDSRKRLTNLRDAIKAHLDAGGSGEFRCGWFPDVTSVSQDSETPANPGSEPETDTKHT